MFSTLPAHWFLPSSATETARRFLQSKGSRCCRWPSPAKIAEATQVSMRAHPGVVVVVAIVLVLVVFVVVVRRINNCDFP